MKLVLDEHFAPAIADQLKKRGHDVVAVAAMPELGNREDAEVLDWATAQRRTLVTENAIDYAALHQQWLSRGDRHSGIVLTGARRFRRSRAGIGRLVRALDGLLRRSSGDAALEADFRWL